MANHYKKSEAAFRHWGSWEVIHVSASHTVKILVILAGKSSSLQTHKHRDEHWLVTEGNVTVHVDGKVIHAKPGSYIFIQKEQKHRLINESCEPATLVEVMLGTILDEGDILRHNGEHYQNDKQ